MRNSLLYSLFDFDRDFFRFSVPTEPRVPYTIVREEDKAIIVHKAVGIDKKDLDVTTESSNGYDYLVIKGETKNELTGSIYNVSSRFKINPDEIKDIEYKVENGLVFIEVFFKEPVKTNVKITEKR